MLVVLLANCDSRSSDYRGRSSGSSYQATKITLEEKEKRSPTSFLSSEGTYKKNFFGEWVLEGTISNSATIAKYKDVVLNVHFYSKTKTLLGTQSHTIYEYFPAGRSKSFKIKTMGYKGTKSVGWDLVRASSSN